ncbi:glycoside hydrolase family 20 protein [Teratosphaeria destructans]|uniref:beta-N-acetylhexosaminidase n=1 Tax=Teratosphaeria destructans TaxID=418781 RepID=A0A9W7VZ26_9PEZI|nr:glycoside hydrolase family 20 protein [Teratosphaeria destructans]
MDVLLVASFFAPFIVGNLLAIPTVPFTSDNTDDVFTIDSVDRIVVDSRFADARDTAGWTLIPPTLQEFAITFQNDFSDLTTRKIDLATSRCTPVAGNVIQLTLGNSSEFVDAAGRWTSEAYQLEVTTKAVIITGASPLGVWWGTRTLLQQTVLQNGRLSVGSGVDAPGWNTRGVFLDVARHYYAPSFLVELCSWMSYWKQNTFHIHLSDNLYNNENYTIEQQTTLYARLRLWSNESSLAGLNTHPNESYTRQDFDTIQSSCAIRGVTVIPEIEAPGHALVISQWKPELALNNTLDLLNITKPETIATMETIWNTFLPWFQSKAVHIGADEYVSDSYTTYELATAYNDFVNTMASYIDIQSGKSMRIWGTYPPKANYTNNISKNITIQHWERFEDNALFDYVNNGYSVINADDMFYIVSKYSGSYAQTLNKTVIFHGDPSVPGGGPFSPVIFDTRNASNNAPRDTPYILGHLAAIWNDFGYNTSTYLEAYYAWRDYLPALASMQWGGGITESQYDQIFAVLQASAPAQNLDRTIKSNGSLIVEYNFGDLSLEPGGSYSIADMSGNGYNAWSTCSSCTDSSLIFTKNCAVSTPLTSKGRNYTLSFSVMQNPESPPGPLFSGPDSELWSGNGSSTEIMLISAGNAIALNYSLASGVWTDLSLIGRGNRRFLSVDGSGEMEFTTKIGVIGNSFVWREMSIVAPLATIGGGEWEGEMRSVKLLGYA